MSKVTFNTEELQRRLGQLGGVVDKKGAMESFKYVYLYGAATQGGGLAVHLKCMCIDATLDITLSGAVTDGPVGVLLPFEKLVAIVSAITNKEITIVSNSEQDAVLSSGRLRAANLDTYPLSGLPSFLENPTSSIAAIGLPGLQSQISNVLFCVPDNDGKHTVSVARLEGTGDNLLLVGTDGFRLVVSKVPQQVPAFGLSLPKSSLEKISRLEGGPSGNITLAEVEGGFYFYTDTEVLTINRTAGEFPPYQRIIETAANPVGTVIIESAKEFLSIIKQTKPLADSEKPVLTFTYSEGILAVEAASKKQAAAQPGEMRFSAQADMDAKVTGQPGDFSLDIHYFLPFLEKVQETPITIYVKSNTAIVDFHGANGQVEFLQMPTNPASRI